MKQHKPFTEKDWSILKQIRRRFIEANGSDTIVDYWHSDNELELYHRSFAQRIGWKWSSVIEHSNIAKFENAEIVDIGCGSGIAAEAFLKHHAQSVKSLTLMDRSARATAFARKNLQENYPSLKIYETQSINDLELQGRIVLISHILSEVDDLIQDQIYQIIKDAAVIIWVEPGRSLESKKLVTLRDRLISSNKFVATGPCPHQLSCPLAESNKDWCHFFAKPPSEAFTTPFWGEFQKNLNIEISTLPVSFFILEKSLPLTEPRASIVIGSIVKKKGHHLALSCSENGQIKQLTITKKSQPATYKKLKKPQLIEIINEEDK